MRNLNCFRLLEIFCCNQGQAAVTLQRLLDSNVLFAKFLDACQVSFPSVYYNCTASDVGYLHACCTFVAVTPCTSVLTEQQRQPECRLMPLSAFLLSPVQRVTKVSRLHLLHPSLSLSLSLSLSRLTCQYPLLLDRICRYTPEHHPEKASLLEVHTIPQAAVSSLLHF